MNAGAVPERQREPHGRDRRLEMAPVAVGRGRWRRSIRRAGAGPSGGGRTEASEKDADGSDNDCSSLSVAVPMVMVRSTVTRSRRGLTSLLWRCRRGQSARDHYEEREPDVDLKPPGTLGGHRSLC